MSGSTAPRWRRTLAALRLHRRTNRPWTQWVASPYRGRSLVGEMFFVHLAFATLVAVLAVSGMWWTSRWVLEENLRKWAIQWVTQLDDLGAPLYVAPDREEFRKLERYARQFPEIAFVRYYTADGEVIHAEIPDPAGKYRDVPLLSQAQFDELEALAQEDRPYRLDDSLQPGRLFRATTCIWAQSLLYDGLLGFDPHGAEDEARSLLGYVELGLDFGRYEDRMTRSVINGALAVAIALFFLAVVGRHTLQRALRPLAQLKEPITRLAEGDIEVDVDVSSHAEIRAINNALASTISALQERDQKLRQLANFDPLTGLMSRRCFDEDLEKEVSRVVKESSTSALFFVDLDQFKYVNDTLGHAAGDRLLMQAAERLQDTLRSEDQICRFGGDEFAVLARNVSRTEADALARGLVESTGAIQFLEDERPFHIRCSVGVTMIDSDDTTARELVAQADMACHEAKSRGRNRHEFYKLTEEERSRLETDTGWNRRIRKALENDEFELRYQPIIRLTDRKPVLYEVLLRMKGDGRKVVAPGAFLPAARRFGLMMDVDTWVLRNTIRALADFRRQYGDVALTLNLSGLTFGDPQFAGHVAQLLEKNAVPAAAVVFEVTEQVAIRHVAEASKVMRQLKSLGCGFALDDFGAGFSSFNYLKQLPVDYLKIDGSFIEDLVDDETDQALVRSIVQIAAAVDMKTIAEYVRNEATVTLLRKIGVDYAQGYHIGRPRKTLAGRRRRSERSPRSRPAKPLGV